MIKVTVSKKNEEGGQFLVDDLLGDEVGFFTGVDDDGLESFRVSEEIAVGLEWSDSEGSNFHGLILIEGLIWEKTLLMNQRGWRKPSGLKFDLTTRRRPMSKLIISRRGRD